MRQKYQRQVANDFKEWLYVLLGQDHVRFGSSVAESLARPEKAGGTACSFRHLEDEKCPRRYQQKSKSLSPGKWTFEIQRRKECENNKRYNFLDGFELRRGINGAAKPVRRNGQTIFKKSEAPTYEDDRQKRHLFVTKVPIPSGGHEGIGADQQKDW